MNPTSRDLDSTMSNQEIEINVPSSSNPTIEPHQPPKSTSDYMFKPWSPKLPIMDLLVGRREDYIGICVPLYEASTTGDWEAAVAILARRPELVRFAITENGDTALHVAASAQDKQVENFIENLVNLMTMADLELQNKNGNTALFLAATGGSVKMVEVMLNKNMGLLEIPGNQEMMALYVAALFGRDNMVRYLYDMSRMMSGDFWTDTNRAWVLYQCVEADIFVFAVIGLEVQPIDSGNHALDLLSIIWGNTQKLPKLKIDDILRGPQDYILGNRGNPRYSSRILFVAAEMGNTRFLVELLRTYPDLISKVNDDGHSIFHIAVMHRREAIYNLLYELGSMKSSIVPLKDKDGNNMLHLVGMTSKQMRPQTSGASLLMQRELLWFKEVEKMMPPSYRQRKNKDGLTPYEVFSKNNEDLVSQGLEWMKDCMVVATLIVTVAFAVAFTVPGGYNQTDGIPMFVHKPSFLVFVIADAISLFTSSTSLLVFLSILTSRHGQRDFFNSLPKKLMLGLGMLFVSVTAMMVTFGASFFVLYRNELKWVPILISILATMPVLLFAILQFPMLVDMFRSMYDSTYLFKPKKRMIYNPKLRF